MTLYNTGLGAIGTNTLLTGRKKLHFIGIGGVQMRALATLCAARGLRVSGCDDSPRARASLAAEGFALDAPGEYAHLTAADAVVYSLAIDGTHPAYCAAAALGVPVISRADLLASLMSPYETRVAIAGSHGKSSVTAMLAHVLTQAGRDPTVIAGANLPETGSPLRIGGGATVIAEACEYRDSFLALSPTHGTLLSFDLDHVDYFANDAALAASFAAFAARCHTLVANVEDATCSAIANMHENARTFGIHEGDVYARELQGTQGRYTFHLMQGAHDLGKVSLAVPGLHNVKNALATAAIALELGVDAAHVTAALSDFQGVDRRLSPRGLFRGAALVEDYAHHPREVAAALAAMRESAPTGRLFVVFEPHTYSRTAAFLDALSAALSKADRVFVTDIYPAREQNTYGVTPRDLTLRIGAHATHVGNLTATARALAREIAPLDSVLLLSAGQTAPFFEALL